jgi:hypothetical protein
MSAAIRFKVQSRLVPAAVAAKRLGLALDDFLAKLPDLRREGFPPAVPVAGNFDLVAIDAWIDRQAGLVARDAAAADATELMHARLRAAFDG